VRSFAVLCALALFGGCMERGDRLYLEDQPDCEVGERRCVSGVAVCVRTARGATWQVEDDCEKRGLVCAPDRVACTRCLPSELTCDGQTVLRCDDQGNERVPVTTCNDSDGLACRNGACVNLCQKAARERSNVGCEYWAVDLDNAMIDDTLNAAAQQFAVVLSNPQPDYSADVVIEQDDSKPGEPNQIVEVARARVGPFSQWIFRLGPREVDGSAPGTFNTGTHTALTRHAYRIRSSVPLVAYQFNPLQNVGVFSNDASLLKPVEALVPLGQDMSDAYVVLGWPQTIATTDDPRTNFDSDNPIDLRAFVTLVGTRPDTRVRIVPTARVLGGGPVEETLPGEPIELTLGEFEVLNLESDDFNADFTGSTIATDGPVVVFSGSEASDAPWFTTISRRRCCADHLEEQLDPIRTAGTAFVATVSPNRTEALIKAGAKLGLADQPEYFRVIAVTDGGARVTTSLEGEYARFVLPAKGSFLELESDQHFTLKSDNAVMLASVSPSQAAANIPSGMPGGDPSLLIVPPTEQFRSAYVFLTPDFYAFDFVRIIAPLDASIVFNSQALEDLDDCTTRAIQRPANAPIDRNSAAGIADRWVVHTCQLSFPKIDADAAAESLTPGLQGDGPQFLVSDRPVGVLVDGFDNFVSYAYAGGTELALIVPE
jgi:hypothetical protein